MVSLDYILASSWEAREDRIDFELLTANDIEIQILPATVLLFVNGVDLSTREDVMVLHMAFNLSAIGRKLEKGAARETFRQIGVSDELHFERAGSRLRIFYDEDEYERMAECALEEFVAVGTEFDVRVLRDFLRAHPEASRSPGLGFYAAADKANLAPELERDSRGTS